MYTEHSLGHWLGWNYLSDIIGKSKSQLPMNIREDKSWNKLETAPVHSIIKYNEVAIKEIIKKLKELAEQGNEGQ